MSWGEARLAAAAETGTEAPATVTPDSPVPLAASADHPIPSPGESDAVLDQARAIVAVAERLFLAGHYAAALAEYARAYQVLAGHPRQYWVLHNLANCNESMFRYDLAVDLY